MTDARTADEASAADLVVGMLADLGLSEEHRQDILTRFEDLFDDRAGEGEQHYLSDDSSEEDPFDNLVDLISWEDISSLGHSEQLQAPARLATTVSKNDGFRVIPPCHISCSDCGEMVEEGEKIFRAVTSDATVTRLDPGVYRVPEWYKACAKTETTIMGREKQVEKLALDDTDNPFWSHIANSECRNWAEDQKSLHHMLDEITQQMGETSQAGRVGQIRVLRIVRDFYPAKEQPEQEGDDGQSDEEQDGDASDASGDTVGP